MVACPAAVAPAAPVLCRALRAAGVPQQHWHHGGCRARRLRAAQKLKWEGGAAGRAGEV
jgi:hypothetical protein